MKRRRGPWAVIIEAWRLKMELSKACRPVVADLLQLDEQDPDPHLSGKLVPDAH